MEKCVDIMIIGAQKAGTTSILRYLGEHPQCISHPQKEFSYFTDPKEHKQGLKKALTKFFAAEKLGPGIKIVCKNASVYADEIALARLQQHNPQCKIILIFRNPVERTYSSYLMEKNYGSVKFDFTQLPELIRKHEENDERWDFSFFISYGFYANYLKMVYTYFPKEQVKVILYQELKKDTKQVCKDLFNFIGINPDFIPNTEIKHNVTQMTRSIHYAKFSKIILTNESLIKRFLKLFIKTNNVYKYGELLRNLNKTNKKHEKMDPEIRKFLVNYFKPHNDELEVMIGKDLSEWNK